MLGTFLLEIPVFRKNNHQCHRRVRGGGSHLQMIWGVGRVKTGSGEGEIQEVRPLLYVEWNTARLRDCWSTRSYPLLPGLHTWPCWDNILNSIHSTDVETVLTERGHNRAPLSKRRGDFNSERNKQQRRKLWGGDGGEASELEKIRTTIRQLYNIKNYFSPRHRGEEGEKEPKL